MISSLKSQIKLKHKNQNYSSSYLIRITTNKI